ncbi:hypothetical protein CK203_046100 [Vitis vinifera]|uniref:Uncharacterized protein n=1 Tax=Vitis vinifera TaxID=29760 RepID=A0A438HP52_VITVI|nr:hypothetical protein CK203_046100 [Vitis vinifera]
MHDLELCSLRLVEHSVEELGLRAETPIGTSFIDAHAGGVGVMESIAVLDSETKDLDTYCMEDMNWDNLLDHRSGDAQLPLVHQFALEWMEDFGVGASAVSGAEMENSLRPLNQEA